MSKATRRMIRLAQWNLCGILCHLLTKSHNSKSIFEWKEYLKMPSWKTRNRWKEINKKLQKLIKGPCTKSLRNDLKKDGDMILSEESSHVIHKMGNLELIELRQTSASIQCHSCLKHVPEGLNMCLGGVWLRPNQRTMNRIKARFEALIAPFYRATLQSRGRKHGHNQWHKTVQKP